MAGARERKTPPPVAASGAALDAWTAIMASEKQRPGVQTIRMFGTEALQVRGKVYAFVYKGDLVLKLPEADVEKFLTAGRGTLFDPGHGRTSMSWVAVSDRVQEDWPSLVKEARTYVASIPAKKGSKRS